MATKLTKPVYREVHLPDGRDLVVGLEPGRGITLREKGRRAESAYDVPFEAAYSVGAKIAARENGNHA